ncbi:response regulator transcription factor (plasmid) [Streptomyces sp. NBC_00868]|uniref:helix-turn-helix transcriptional regulator n=1 Tax=Streptomyces sp. NBC_00868 TaxID=2903683 RepID=UPI002F907983|nr:response regulator transcription factor [Streptomyces sp. NBC_00868]
MQDVITRPSRPSAPALPSSSALPSLSALPANLLVEADQAALTAARSQAARNVALLVSSPVIRAGLEALLDQVASVGVVLALDAETLHTPYAPGSFDVLIVASEQWHVLENAQDDRSCPLPPVLVLGDPTHDRRNAAFASLPGDGFLSLADLSGQSLADAMDRTLAGEVPMPAALARELLSMHRIQLPHSVSRSATLTPRENETLQLMASGMSNKQIARALTISTHGAKRLVGSILAKFDAPNRTAAVVSAVNAGLV